MPDPFAKLSPAIYFALVLLRLSFALLGGTGYIHPDEYFQNGEAVAGRALGVHTWVTWEWDPHFPARSIVPVWISTGIPLWIVGWVSQGAVLSPRVIFTVERLSFLSSSFVLDYVLYYLVHEYARMHALVLLGSSYLLHTFQIRPFSNSIETILLALSLLLLKKLLVAEKLKAPVQTMAAYLSALAFVAVYGVFVRVTFAAFILPIAFQTLLWSLRETKFSLLPWVRLVAPALLVAALTLLGLVYADNTYFTLPSRTTPVLTPLNLLRYNILPENIAAHPVHPRWLHLLVNLPMLVTPQLLFYALRAQWDSYNFRLRGKGGEEIEDRSRYGVTERMQEVFYWVVISGITLLSIQPHQEARYLLPVITPIIALVVNNGRILRAGKTFWASWIVTNAILAILFGIFHQAGVVPSLFRVHDILYDPTNGIATRDFHVVYWKTYMPPRHLLSIRSTDTHAVAVTDFSGADPDVVIQGFHERAHSSRPLSTLLVAPFHAVHRFGENAQECVTERTRVFPHLDLDHIGETVEIGWRDGLSIGIFDVDQACLGSARPAS